jgi:hypothetical protein
LPRGFVKIRHSGLLANRGRTERLAVCRSLLALGSVVGLVLNLLGGASATARPQSERCPVCGSGPWAVVRELPRGSAASASASACAPVVTVPDTS